MTMELVKSSDGQELFYKDDKSFVQDINLFKNVRSPDTKLTNSSLRGFIAVNTAQTITNSQLQSGRLISSSGTKLLTLDIHNDIIDSYISVTLGGRISMSEINGASITSNCVDIVDACIKPSVNIKVSKNIKMIGKTWV